MKTLYLLIGVFFLQFTMYNSSKAQSTCLPDGITFNFQYQIDEFPLLYPGCTEILGDVHIEGYDPAYQINNLDSLIQLTAIDGSLSIGFNDTLANLSGLDNLEKIGGKLNLSNNSILNNIASLSNIDSLFDDLTIEYNDALPNLTGLDNLKYVGGRFDISDNGNLNSLTGLNNLNKIEGDFYIGGWSLNNISALSNLTYIGGELYISGTALTNLSGLENVSYIGWSLGIDYNTELTSLSGLSGFSSIGGSLFFNGNTQLQDLTGLENLTAIDGVINIWNNDNLTSLNGIQNIDPNTIESNGGEWGPGLNIAENYNLSQCSVQSICGYLDLPDATSYIDLNDDGCNSEEEVIANCPTPPDCTYLIEPADGETDVNITTDLTWEAAEDADGYLLCVGTYSGGTDIEDSTDVGDVTTYDPGDFPCGSTIYVTIIPYNVAGNAQGCPEESFTTEFVVADAGNDIAFCAGGSGQLSASGGTTYSWSPTTGLSDPNIANPIASPSATTIYTVTVSNDGRCPDSDQVTVTVYPNPVPNASATDETGNDFNDGTATANPTNGLAPYSYEWSNNEFTQTITGLAPGDYTVTVSDFNGCSADETVTVHEFICPQLTIEADVVNTSCYGYCDGSITITGVTNGVPPFIYSWSNGATTASISDLCVQGYSVTVTDSKNCTVSDSFYISQPPLLLANATATDETANGANDGTASAYPTGGTPPYYYNWSTGSHSQTIIGLSPGIYSVTVTDNNDCMNVDTVTVYEYICPETVEVEADVLNVLCYGDCDGSITITSVTGGEEPYTYEWSTGDSTTTINNLCEGTYSVVVTDSKNCSYGYAYYVEQPDELKANATGTDETANGANDGTATANPSGGTPPYQYNWSNGATTQSISNLAPGQYTVTVTDENLCTDIATVHVNSFECGGLEIIADVNPPVCNEDCNGSIEIMHVQNAQYPLTYKWSTGATDSIVSNLCNGSYSVTVTDAKNCIVSDTFYLNTSSMLLTVLGTDSVCYGECNGYLHAICESGNPPVSYFWSTGDTISEITDLCAGTYTVTVTDSKGCTSSTSKTIGSYPEIVITLDEVIHVTDTTRGSISVTINNNGRPYSFEWSGRDGVYHSAEEDISNLDPGCYELRVWDNESECSTTLTVCIDDKTPVMEVDGEDGITVFPNPADNTVYILTKNTNTIIKKLELYDLSGKYLKVAAHHGRINTSAFEPGVYIIKILTGEGTVYKKLLISH